MSLLNKGRGPFPHLAAKAAHHRSLADDLDRVARGQHPGAADLEGAPLMTRWCVRLQPWPHLFGTAHDHPTVADGRECRTSELFTFDPDRHYARTFSRWWRLGPRPGYGDAR